MTAHFGDFDTTETVVIPFNTFDSNDPSNSVTATTFAATDVHIHKDGSLTQRTSANGVAIDIDVDGIAGCHWVTIDLSDDTDAGFYANGAQISVRVEGVTVDGGNVNAWVGAFTIGRMLRPTTAGRTLDVNATGEAGLDLDNTSGTIAAAQLAADCITAAKIAAGAIDNATFAADVGSTAYATNVIALAADKALVEQKLDHLVAVADADDAVNDSIVAKLASKAATADWSAYDNTTDSLEANRDNLGTNVSGDISSDIAVMDAVCDAILVDTANPALRLAQTTIATLASQTDFTLTAGSADDTAYANAIVVVTDAVTAVQEAVGRIQTYTGATKRCQLYADPGVFTMAATDNIVVVADPTFAEIGTAGANLSALPNQTMDITGDITGNLSGSVGSVTGAVGSVTGAVGSVTGAVGSVAGNVDGSTASVTGAVGSVTGAVGSVTGAVGSVGGNVDGNVTGSVGSLAAQAKADVNAEVDTALDTAIPELGVAAPTATPTVRTGLMLLYMALRNKLVVQTSGTDALEIHNNAGTKIASKTLTDDGSDYTEAEMS